MWVMSQNLKNLMYEKIQFYDEFTAKNINVNTLSAKPTKWSNTLKQFNFFLLFLLAVSNPIGLPY